MTLKDSAKPADEMNKIHWSDREVAMGGCKQTMAEAREVLACLMSSPIYFDLDLVERLALFKKLSRLAVVPLDRR